MIGTAWTDVEKLDGRNATKASGQPKMAQDFANSLPRVFNQEDIGSWLYLRYHDEYPSAIFKPAQPDRPRLGPARAVADEAAHYRSPQPHGRRDGVEYVVDFLQSQLKDGATINIEHSAGE